MDTGVPKALILQCSAKTRTYSKDIGMSFGLDKCGQMISRREKVIWARRTGWVQLFNDLPLVWYFNLHKLAKADKGIMSSRPGVIKAFWAPARSAPNFLSLCNKDRGENSNLLWLAPLGVSDRDDHHVILFSLDLWKKNRSKLQAPSLTSTRCHHITDSMS